MTIVQSRLIRLEESKARYRGLVASLLKIVDEFDSSPEPRSYSHVYNALRALLKGFKP